MKRVLAIVAVASLMTACGSIKPNGSVSEQKLATSFVNEKIKIETKCAWFGYGSDCHIVAIEATGTSASYGNTVSNRKVALTRAEMRDKANVAEFIDNQISTSRVNTTIAKTIERASDKVREGKADGSTVEMTDTEAKNISLHESGSDTASTLTETIRSSAQAVLRGFRKIDEKVVGDQEVAVTIRWDLESNNSRKQLVDLMQ